MSRGPKQKTFKFGFFKILFKISDNRKHLIIIKRHHKSGSVIKLGMITKSQARCLADWLEWWTK